MEKQRLYGVLFKAYLGLLLAGLAFWGGWHLRANRYFTPWMTQDRMNAYLGSLGQKDGDGKDYWERRHWFEAFECRFRGGVEQYRIRFGEPPREGEYDWWCEIDLTEAELQKRDGKIRQEGAVQVQAQSCRTDDGLVYCNAVWHKVAAGGRLSHPIPPPPFPPQAPPAPPAPSNQKD